MISTDVFHMTTNKITLTHLQQRDIIVKINKWRNNKQEYN